METEWKFTGDVNLKYGGYYHRYDMDYKGFPYYAEIVRITDLDFVGANGLTLIEKLTTFDYSNKQRIQSALSCLGLTTNDFKGKSPSDILDIITEAYLSYGYYNPLEDYITPSQIIVVNDNYNAYSNKLSWDGWEPDIEETVKLHHVYNGNLRDYIESEYL